jgi:hypothetical protein
MESRVTVGFDEDLRRRYEACRRRGRANYWAAFFVLLIAVSGSALATVSIAIGIWPKHVNAILAAFPGAMYLLNRQFRFEERSRWWFKKFYAIEGLHRGLTRENRSETEISQELTEHSRKWIEKWPGFGEAPRA